MAKSKKKASGSVPAGNTVHADTVVVDIMPPSYQTADITSDHKHDDDDAHGHSHDGDHGHSHSHGGSRVSSRTRPSPSPSSRLVTKSPRSASSAPEDMCAHLAIQTTECGHPECMSEEEKKASSAKRVLITASLFCLFFMICELVGGYVSNSLAIISDAFHLLTDVLSFLISIISLNFSRRAVTSNSSFSYGYHRIEVLGALVSILFIYLLTGVLLFEAIERIRTPQEVDGRTMFVVAALGLCVNVAMGVILMSSGHGHSHGIGGGMHGHSHGEEEHGDDHGHEHGSAYATESSALLSDAHEHEHEHGHDDHDHDHGHGHSSWSPMALLERMLGNKSTDNINVRAAFIHVLGDALQSIGVMFAAALIWWNPKYTIADPICTFIFSLIVLTTTWRIMREGILVLMEGVPPSIEPRAVIASIKNLPGVEAVHDLHVWALSVGNHALSVHVMIEESADGAKVLRDVQDVLKRKYDISHITVQIEHDTADLGCHEPKRGCLREVVV